MFSMNLNPVVIVFLVVIGLPAFMLLLMIRDTVRRKGRWGINFDPVKCPSCGYKAPKPRKASSLRQVAWGGACCSKCGCEFDKWGVEVRL
jgi:hypothetical protein